jgi:beta-aspartyl-peptidase (threonine type)
MSISTGDKPGTARTLAIAVHGGAWAIPPHLRAKSEEGVRRAVQIGYAVLARGGSALEAVEAAVRVLEDDPVFDAGTGSVLNAAGEVVSLVNGFSDVCMPAHV